MSFIHLPHPTPTPDKVLIAAVVLLGALVIILVVALLVVLLQKKCSGVKDKLKCLENSYGKSDEK